MSACKAIMQPIGLTVKHRKNKYGGWLIGELMLINCCNDCGKISINRIAADDQVDRLMELFSESLSLSEYTRNQLESHGIEILQAEHAESGCLPATGSVPTLKTRDVVHSASLAIYDDQK